MDALATLLGFDIGADGVRKMATPMDTVHQQGEMSKRYNGTLYRLACAERVCRHWKLPRGSSAGQYVHTYLLT